MFAVGDTKVEIGVLALVDAVGGSCSADGHDGCRALGALSMTNLLDSNHVFGCDWIKLLMGMALKQWWYKLYCRCCCL